MLANVILYSLYFIPQLCCTLVILVGNCFLQVALQPCERHVAVGEEFRVNGMAAQGPEPTPINDPAAFQYSLRWLQTPLANETEITDASNAIVFISLT